MPNIPLMRESLVSWIQHAPEETVLALNRVRRNLDANLKKPAPPEGWRKMEDVAKKASYSIGHLARICREIYAAQELARLCLRRGRQTWYLAPAAVSQLIPASATDAPTECGDGSAIASQTTCATAAPSEAAQVSCAGPTIEGSST